MISSNTTTGAVFIGTTLTLTCAVELSPAVDIPVTVNVQLSDPSGRTLATTPPSVSGSTYTFTTTIEIVTLAQSGAYICAASLNSTSPFLTSSQLTTEQTTIIMAGDESLTACIANSTSTIHSHSCMIVAIKDSSIIFIVESSQLLLCNHEVKKILFNL